MGFFFFFQAEDGIRSLIVTGVQTCALPISRLAALRATPGDIDKLFEAAEASRKARDPDSYEKADAAFHRRIAIAARNPLLITIFDAILNVASDGKWRHGRETAHCINNQAT